MTGKISNSEALKFILGGNSTVTFINTKSGNRFTYKIKKYQDGKVSFVKVLTSPDLYTFIGSIMNDFKWSLKSKISNDAQSVKVFNWVFNKLKVDDLPEFIEIWHEGKCGRCGRELTVPESIKSGFGPECIKKTYGKNN